MLRATVVQIVVSLGGLDIYFRHKLWQTYTLCFWTELHALPSSECFRIIKFCFLCKAFTEFKSFSSPPCFARAISPAKPTKMFYCKCVLHCCSRSLLRPRPHSNIMRRLIPFRARFVPPPPPPSISLSGGNGIACSHGLLCAFEFGAFKMAVQVLYKTWKSIASKCKEFLNFIWIYAICPYFHPQQLYRKKGKSS